MKKILIMCEGPNELKVVNLLLDHGKLKFSRDDLSVPCTATGISATEAGTRCLSRRT